MPWLLLALSAVPLAAQGWIVEPVDTSSTTYFGASSISTDAFGTVEVAYIRGASEQLLDAVRDSLGWRLAPIESAGGGDYAISALRVLGSGRRLLAYTMVSPDFRSWRLELAEKDGSVWQSQCVDSGPWTDSSARMPRPWLCVTPDDAPFIAYAYLDSDTSHAVRCAWRSGDTWERHTVWSRFERGRWLFLCEPVMALTSTGNPVIAFASYYSAPVDSDYLFRAEHAAGTWHVDTVLKSYMSGCRTYGAAMDGGDTFHVVYTRDWLLCHAAWFGDSANEEILRGPFGRGEEAADMVSDRGQVHVVSSSVMDYLAHSRRDSSGWQTDTIGSELGLHPSIAVDGHGAMHVSTAMGNGLHYARHASAGVVMTAQHPVRVSALAVRPNPCRIGQTLTITAPANAEALTLHDATGRSVWSASIPSHSPLLLPDLRTGVYLVRLQSGSVTTTTKLVVQH